MRLALLLVLSAIPSMAFAGNVGRPPATYDSIGVRTVNEAPALKAGESIEVEVVTPTKLGDLGLSSLKAGDKITVTCVTPGSVYTVQQGKTTVKLKVSADGSVAIAR